MNINFTIYGIARSGTSVFVRALNESPNVFCSMEFFNNKDNHSTIDVPSAFLDKTRFESRAIKNSQALELKSGDIKYGNKSPGYDKVIDEISAQLPGITHIGIYREQLGFMSSWDKRADKQNSWNKGCVGLLAPLVFAEHVRMLHTLKEKRNVWLFPYRELFFSDGSLFSKVFDTLGVTVEPKVLEKIKRKYVNKLPYASPTPEQEYACKVLDVNFFDDLVRSNHDLPISDWPNTFRDYAAFVGHEALAYLIKVLPQLDADALAYLPVLLKRKFIIKPNK